jgi:hypothetical protein
MGLTPVIVHLNEQSVVSFLLYAIDFVLSTVHKMKSWILRGR